MFAQPFALLIDVTVGAATEVDALEGTGTEPLCRHYLFQLARAVLMNDECLARHQLMHILSLDVERGLQHRALAGDGYYLVVAIVECRTDTPGVAYREHLARARQSTHDVTAVVVLHRGA